MLLFSLECLEVFGRSLAEQLERLIELLRHFFDLSLRFFVLIFEFFEDFLKDNSFFEQSLVLVFDIKVFFLEFL